MRALIVLAMIGLAALVAVLAWNAPRCTSDVRNIGAGGWPLAGCKGARP